MNLFIHFQCDIAFHCIIKLQFIHLSPVDRPLGRFHCDTVMNNAAKHLLCILVLVWMGFSHVHIYLRISSLNEIMYNF